MKKTFLKILVVVSSMLMLSACGGGGGGTASSGTTTPITTDPTLTTPARPIPVTGPGTSRPPVTGTVPMNAGMPPVVAITTAAVTVPNSLIPDAGTGTKQSYYMAGGGYGGDVRNYISSVFSNGITAFGKRLQDASNNPKLTLYNGPYDVRQAWRDGWTGAGVNLLIIDGFGAPGRTGATHGYVVGASAVEIAPGANYFALDVGLEPFVRYTAGSGRLERPDSTIAPFNTRIDVINMSFGTDPINPATITQTELRRRLIGINTDFLYNDVLGGDLLTKADNAVLVKAAGNESADSFLVLENAAFVFLDVTKSRSLIVGALDKYARSNNARLAGYSNRAGIIPAMQERFLVEYGGSPFPVRAVICDAGVSGCRNGQLAATAFDVGSSFAAPRVAGFAALVRHKFPSLSGAQTAKILLDTATYQGLACHRSSSCAVSIYGQGRVDIGTALSPIGELE